MDVCLSIARGRGVFNNVTSPELFIPPPPMPYESPVRPLIMMLMGR